MQSTLVAATSGLISCVAIHKSKRMRGDTALLLTFVVFSSIALARFHFTLDDFPSSIVYSSYILSIHLAVVALATVIWRLSPFHPLAAFPGPILCRISSLYLAYIVLTGKRHEIINSYHHRYGRFVRTGPNTLSINANHAIAQIYNSATCFDKSSAYTMGRSPGRGLFFMRGREEHNIRRKLWAPAFSRAAVDEYQKFLERRTLQLCACIEERSNPATGVDLTECIHHWSYDIMGDITFGGASRLELMAEGDVEGFIACGQAATMALEVLGEVPWLFDILWHLPTATADLHRLQQIAGKFINDRSGSASSTPDICSHLLGEHGTRGDALSHQDLILDTLFAVQAGSDTTSAVIIYAFFFILAFPEVYDRLKKELMDAFPNGAGLFDQNALANLPYLNAVIEESLRLGTPFTGLRRVTPPQGAIVGGHFIPGGTVVGVPGHAQQIDEENFSPDPLVFRPERWLDKSGANSICRRSGVLSFSFGPFSCLGKQFAYQELRTVIACLITTFPTLRFAHNFNVQAFEKGVLNRKSTIFQYPLRVMAMRK